MSDVPVATEDGSSVDGSKTILGTQVRQEAIQVSCTPYSCERTMRTTVQDGDSSLPSSSPIRYSSTSVGDADEGAAATRASYDSSSLWDALSSLPRTPVRTMTHFDEHEASPFEDGEVAEGKTESVSQAGLYQREDEEATFRRQVFEGHQEYTGEPAGIRSMSYHVPTARKRLWEGSASSEERNRPGRRARRENEEEGGEGRRTRLPSINEILNNPWGERGDVARARSTETAPVPVSTPKPYPCHVSETGGEDSNANMSGHPPTRYEATLSRRTNSSQGRTRKNGNTGAHGRDESRCGEDPSGEEDVDMDDAGDNLLRAPRNVQRNAQEFLGPVQDYDRRQERLHKILKDPEPDHTRRMAGDDKEQERRAGNPRWQGGYLPPRWNELQDARGRVRQRAVDELLGGGPADSHSPGRGERRGSGARPSGDARREAEAAEDEEERLFFSAIPNTKAWEHQENRRANDLGEARKSSRKAHEQTIREMGREEERQGRGYSRGGRDGWGTETQLEADRRERRYPRRTEGYQYEEAEHGEEAEEDEDEDGDALHANDNFEDRGGRRRSYDAWQGGREGQMEIDEEEEDADRTWRDLAPEGAVPTAVARDPHTADYPVTLDDPTSPEWAVHFDDPEALILGQSEDWTREIWRDTKPNVMLTIYNYKYTSNGDINKFIDSTVTKMTKLLTGETSFYVVPPDPERG